MHSVSGRTQTCPTLCRKAQGNGALRLNGEPWGSYQSLVINTLENTAKVVNSKFQTPKTK